MEDIALELKNLKALHKLSDKFADPEANIATPSVVWPKWSVREWNPRLGIIEDPRYEEDNEFKP